MNIFDEKLQAAGLTHNDLVTALTNEDPQNNSLTTWEQRVHLFRSFISGECAGSAVTSFARPMLSKLGCTLDVLFGIENPSATEQRLLNLISELRELLKNYP